jgi:hypothetical protein
VVEDVGELAIGQPGVHGHGDRACLVDRGVGHDPAQRVVDRDGEGHPFALRDTAIDEGARQPVRVGVPLPEGDRVARGEVAVADLLAELRRHQPKLVRQQVRHRATTS